MANLLICCSGAERACPETSPENGLKQGWLHRLPGLPRRGFTACWRVVLLAAVTALVWTMHYDRWTRESWSFPTDYGGDSLEILTRIMAASEGDTVPLRPQLITRLGAPFGANWSAYPTSDLPLLWMLGEVARVLGLFPTANLALLLATVSAAVAFYGCARWLRLRWEWAFAGGVLFAFTFQTFHRGLPHLLLGFSWSVPLSLLSSALVASSRRLRFGSSGGWLCLGTSAAIGISNPYTLFMHLQLIGWSLVANACGARRAENLRVGGAAIAIALMAFALVEAPVWLFSPDSAAAPPLVRNYGGTERYALKPVELFVPPAEHRWEAFSFFGNRYVRWSDWRGGESFAPYLGVVGIAGLMGLAITGGRAVFRRRRLPGAALSTTWVLAFASVGGVTNIMAFFAGLLVFRATNRFSIFISATALLFIASHLSRWMRQRPTWLSVGAAALVTAIGLVDQIPRGPTEEAKRQIVVRVSSDLKLGRRIEEILPNRGPIFQLPVLAFPEAKPPHHLTDYEHFRPYLATSRLCFSYGALKGRSRGRWQREIESAPTPELVARLEHSGFAALYINRLGYPDRGEKILGELAALGRTRRLEGASGDQIVVVLEPAKDARPPVARQLTFGRGWHSRRDGEPRWAHGPATLSYHNPFPHPIRARIQFVVSSAGRRMLSIRVNGEKGRATLVGNECTTITLFATIQPGANRIDLDSAEPAVRLSQDRGQLRSFAVHETQVGLEVAEVAMVR